MPSSTAVRMDAVTAKDACCMPGMDEIVTYGVSRSC